MTDPSGVDLSGGLSCPVPISEYKQVLLAHGGGGRLSQRLIDEIFVSRFRNEHLSPLHDGALLPPADGRLAFSTDSFVVNPLFFPGGDIGSLAVNGTVNDVSMCGAKPLYLSTAFIIEEGLPIDVLWKIVLSMEQAAKCAGIEIVTGDTKVVDKGKADRVFINTSGIGVIPAGVDINPRRARAGDKIIVSGTIGDHGMAVMSVREGLEFESSLESDCAPLNGLVEVMLAATQEIHVLRDPTRGGVASALNEIARSAEIGMILREEEIPVAEGVHSACELLGFDPLYVANEGKLLAILPSADADAVLNAMRNHPLGQRAAIIGEVTEKDAGKVLMRSRIGGTRIVDMLSGEQLPRIC